MQMDSNADPGSAMNSAVTSDHALRRRKSRQHSVDKISLWLPRPLVSQAERAWQYRANRYPTGRTPGGGEWERRRVLGAEGAEGLD